MAGLFGLSSLLDSLVAPAGAPPAHETCSSSVAGGGSEQGCTCSKSVGLLRALHIEGLPLTMTASKLSELMTAYGPVQYAEAAPEMAKDDAGAVTGRRLHCYVVFADHGGACLAKRSLQPRVPESPMTPAGGGARAASAAFPSAASSVEGSSVLAALGPLGFGLSPRSSMAGDGLTPRWDGGGLCDALTPRAGSAAGDALAAALPGAQGGEAAAAAAAAAAALAALGLRRASAPGGCGTPPPRPASAPGDAAGFGLRDAGADAPTPPPQRDGARSAAPAPSPPPLSLSPAPSAPAALSPPGAPAPPPALRVRFAKPQNVAASCTPAFRAFIAAQWAQASAIAKACPDPGKKAGCKVNALFISKLHQHITSARLQALFGKFGRMIACEVQYHSDGRSAGHGVVIYETIEDAERALATLNGYRLEGRALEVTPLRLKKLPSKLEHLKNRIKRLPAGPGGSDQSGSEDGGGATPGAGPIGGGGGGLGAALAGLGLGPSPRVSASGGGPGGAGAAALSAHMAAAFAAAAGGGGGGPPHGGPAGALSALSALGLNPGSLGAAFGGMAGQQHAMAAAAAAAAANLQQQQQNQHHHQQQQLHAALAAAQGLHPAAAAALLGAMGAPGPGGLHGSHLGGGHGHGHGPGLHGAGGNAAMLHAHAALLQHQMAAQRAAAAAAAAGLTPQQVAALSAGFAGGGGPGGGPGSGGPLLPGMQMPQHPGAPGMIPPPSGLDLSFL
ncbi:hypothetical protein Rsub_05970 [Raphidocelis subcapitata]|uniref:RRM domain-containing protein n=1 Tax=Raphidocelis subcapitata TaxID=307507 RepID=A0A2V0P038_9CHLO|nr:hypothetical protein Rsub_05970 [Raphidocelis subcapitata]|eukprot:GBF93238.1 hypothetical protein Rsub_05970 [Raphidocelis subcapitata]